MTVKKHLTGNCIRAIISGMEKISTDYQFAAADALVAGDAEKFVKVLKNFFANIPYNLTDRQNEQMWQTIVDVKQARRGSLGHAIDA